MDKRQLILTPRSKAAIHLQIERLKMERSTELKADPNRISTHVLLALLALFLFHSVIFTANLLKIPFYLGYREYIVNIVVWSPSVDKTLWTLSIVTFATLLLIRSTRSELRGSRNVLAVSYGVVLFFSVGSFFFSFEVFHVIALMISGLAFAILAIFHAKFFGDWRLPTILLLFYEMLILLGIEAASLLRWVYNLFSPSLVFADKNWSVAFTEAQISSVLYPILPGVLMVFVFSWIGEFAFKVLLAKDEAAKDKPENSRPILKLSFSKVPWAVIPASVAASLFLGYYNFAISGVFNLGFSGTDTPYYVEALKGMLNTDLAGALANAAKDDRFLYLVFQYFCFLASGSSAEKLVTFVMPVVLTLLLMLATFMFVRIGRNDFHAITVMLVTASSFQVTVGFYAGFYANWFALAVVYVFYGILLAVFKGRRNIVLLVFAVLSSVAVLYIHPWTWILLVMMVPTAYIFVTFLLVRYGNADSRKSVWEAKFLAVLLAINIVMFYVRNSLRVGSGAGVADTEVFAPSLLNILHISYALDRTFNWYLGGFYAYIPIILLAIMGAFSFSDYKDNCNRLLLAWISIDSAMVFVEFPWQARFLYLTPFNIYVTLGMLYCVELLCKLAESTKSRQMVQLVFWVSYTLATLFLLNYAIRCIVIKQFGPAGLTIIP